MIMTIFFMLSACRPISSSLDKQTKNQIKFIFFETVSFYYEYLLLSKLLKFNRCLHKFYINISCRVTEIYNTFEHIPCTTHVLCYLSKQMKLK